MVIAHKDVSFDFQSPVRVLSPVVGDGLRALSEGPNENIFVFANNLMSVNPTAAEPNPNARRTVIL